MPESTERVGQYHVSVAFHQAEDGDHQRRRIDALAAWLLARWESERKEVEHGDPHAAG